MEGRIQKTTIQGDATVESLDPDTVSRLLHYLELTGQVRKTEQLQYLLFIKVVWFIPKWFQEQFTMLVIKKNLHTSEHFPYPVRVEAIFELIDQFPVRKLEKMTRKGSIQPEVHLTVT